MILVAEIMLHSNCDSFGTFKAYEVDWRARRITRTFDQIEAKRLFGRSMGIELRNAPNECIRSPRRCWVSTNHEPDPSAKPSEIKNDATSDAAMRKSFVQKDIGSKIVLRVFCVEATVIHGLFSLRSLPFARSDDAKTMT